MATTTTTYCPDHPETWTGKHWFVHVRASETGTDTDELRYMDDTALGKLAAYLRRALGQYRRTGGWPAMENMLNRTEYEQSLRTGDSPF